MKRPEDRLKPGRKNKDWLKQKVIKMNKDLDAYLNLYLKQKKLKAGLSVDSKKPSYTRSEIVNRAIAFYFKMLNTIQYLKMPGDIECVYLLDELSSLGNGATIPKETTLYKALEVFAKNQKKTGSINGL